MRLCPLCGRPVEELVESSAGDVDRTVVRPCGDLLVGDDLAAFWRRQSAADPAVLRRCTADKALIADLQTDRHRGDPWICESVLNPDGACDCGRDERVARRLTFLAEAYGLKVTE